MGSESESELFREFKNGLRPVIERQVAIVQTAGKTLRSARLSEDDGNALLGRIVDLERAMVLSESSAQSLLEELAPQNLRRKATRDFHAIFDGDRNDHKLSFVELIHIGIKCRNFGQVQRQAWTQIENIVRQMSASSALRADLQARVSGSLRTAGMILELAQKILVWVGGDSSAQDVATLVAQCRYESSKDYGILAAIASSYRDRGARLDTVSQRQATLTVSRSAPTVQSEVTLFAGGTLAWNCSQDYTLSYHAAQLAAETDSFQTIFFAETHLGQESRELRRMLVFNIVKGVQEPKVENRYTRFLWRLFDAISEIQYLQFGIRAERRAVFLFHLGPRTFYMLVRKLLDQTDTGRLHSRGRNPHLYRRHLPVHLIRKTLIEWWRKHILNTVGPARDNLLLCQEIVSHALTVAHRNVDPNSSEPNPMQAISVRRLLQVRRSVAQTQPLTVL